LSAIGGRLAIPLMIFATLFLLMLPIVDERKIYLSEGNLKPLATPVAKLSDLSAPNPFLRLVENGVVSTVVRGRRSPGGTLLSVLVNYDEAPSMLIASALYYVFQQQRANILSGDLEFRFFSRSSSSLNLKKNASTLTFDSDAAADGDAGRVRGFPLLEEASWQVPSEVDIVLLLDIAEITFSAPTISNNNGVGTAAAGGGAQLCLNVFGSDGVQPNMDIVNLMTLLGGRQGIEWNFLCQQPTTLPTPWDGEGMSQASSRDSGMGVGEIAAALKKMTTTVTGGSVTLGNDHAQRLGHYALSLLTASATGSSPDFGGASLRKRGMHPIVVSSPPRCHRGAPPPPPQQKPSIPHNKLLPIVWAMEGLIRGANNLDEQLHHSFPVYVHIGAGSFVDYEVAQHAIFVVLGAILSDMFNAFRGILATATAAAVDGAVVSEWTVLFGSHSRRALLTLVMVLTLSFVAVTADCAGTGALNRRISEMFSPIIELVAATAAESGVALPPAVAVYYATIFAWSASVPMFLSRTFLPLVIVSWMILVKVLSPLCRRANIIISSTSEASIGAQSLVMGVWNCVVVCLLLAYHPLLALPGCLLVGWLQVWTSLCARQRIVATAASSPIAQQEQKQKQPKLLSKITSTVKKIFKVLKRVVSLRLGVALSLAAFLAAESILVLNASNHGVPFVTPVSVAAGACNNKTGGLSFMMLQDVNSVFAIFGVAANVWWFLLSAI
jgi:hypothetical protein